MFCVLVSSNTIILRCNATASHTKSHSHSPERMRFLLRSIIQATPRRPRRRWRDCTAVAALSFPDFQLLSATGPKEGGRDRMPVFLGAISFCPKTNFWRISTVSCPLTSQRARSDWMGGRGRTNKFSNDETVSVRPTTDNALN